MASPAFVATALLSILLTGCHWDVGSNHYASKAEFAKGPGFQMDWLPEIIPDSTVDIDIQDDADFKIVRGRFAFTKSDWSPFVAKLRSGAPANPPWPTDDDFKQLHSDRGLTPWNYEFDGTVWAFFCSAERSQCRFLAWPKDYPFK